jgi:hypothetical protein
MSYIDVLIPLIGGIFALLLPIRAKSADEPEEKVNQRRKLVRICGLVLIGVAVLYLLIKLAQQGR